MTNKTHDLLNAPSHLGVPFSYMLDVDRIPEEGLDIAISAGPKERQARAEFDKIPAIGRFDATFHVTRRGGGRFNVSGEVHARVTQICVATLDPFESDIVETVDVDFAPRDEAELARSAGGRSEAIPAGLDAEQPPDPIIDGKIDLGALAGEFLALGLDPYPRKPGAKFELTTGIGGPREVDSPFEILKQLHGLK